MNANGQPTRCGLLVRLITCAGRVLTVLAITAAAATVLSLALIQAQGRQLLIVASGSMTPALRAGAVVLVHPQPAGTLRPGDVVTFHSPGAPDHLTTHRIVALQPKPQGLFLQTKGDANATPDPDFVAAGNVAGVVTATAPYVGRWLAFYQSPRGKLVVLGVPLLLLLVAQSLSLRSQLRRRSPTPGSQPLPAPRPRPVRVTPVATATLLVLVLASAAGVAVGRETGATYGSSTSLAGNTLSTRAYCPTTTYASAVATDSPTLRYRMNELSGTAAGDSSGSGNGGSYVGGVTLGASGPLACDATTAATFDGSSGYVASSLLVNPPKTYSLETWFKTTAAGGRIVGFGVNQSGASGSNNSDLALYLSDAGRLVFGVDVGATITAVTSPASYTDGGWHHVVVTMSTVTGARLYVDGAQVASASVPSDSGTTKGYWRVGWDAMTSGWPSRPSNLFFGGRLDEVAAYPTVLSAARVSAHYTAGTFRP